MGDEVRNGYKQPKYDSIKNADVNSRVGDIGLRRVRQIEEALGVSISPITSEILDYNNSDNKKSHDQTIQLIRAFDLISDNNVRNDIIEIVIAAAQHENQSD
ncbi:hypothetical protein [Methylobacterium sp. 174MFSha1.1]|uniref:hypothetical protein n=1 Tax=Methylobacterium sp. 174MFSha1.1 TaxID=1502749 RepID=UPI001160AA6E|nr:hypothetical protein [Methylobacterium sp. 174MFSha1.1]